MDIIGEVYGKTSLRVSDLKVFESNYDEILISYRVDNSLVFYGSDYDSIENNVDFFVRVENFADMFDKDKEVFADISHWKKTIRYAYLMFVISIKKYLPDMDYYDIFDLFKDNVFVVFIKTEADRWIIQKFFY